MTKAIMKKVVIATALLAITTWASPECLVPRTQQEEEEDRVKTAEAATATASSPGPRQHLFRRPKVCVDVVDDCVTRIQQQQQQQTTNKTRNLCISDFATLSVQCPASCRLCSPMDRDIPRLLADPQHKETLFLDRIFAAQPQKIDGNRGFETLVKFRETEDYMYNTVYHYNSNATETSYSDKVQDKCLLQHELCTYWAMLGECAKNPSYMRKKCAPACQSCLDFDGNDDRCRRFALDQQTTWPAAALAQPGDLHHMFERIVTDPDIVAHYQPQTLSRPSFRNGTTTTTTDDAPWIVQLDNVLTAEECDFLIQQGTARGFRGSKEAVNQANADSGKPQLQVSQRRTSSTTWCKEACYDHATTQSIHDRLEQLVGIPRTNYEYLQLLKYETGQLYKQHHDYLHHHREKICGVRMLTAYIYLNDVPSGGGTSFPFLNVTVTPQQGRMIIWPSVLNQDTRTKDKRTEHEALPVEQGIKYGANAWIHPRDYKSVHAAGCF